MTTDDFETAARVEARRAWEADGTMLMPGLAVHIAEWARTYLAAQEVSDAEVMKAARALAEAMEDIEEWDSLSAFQHAAYVHLARRALSAARAVGRDAQ